VAQLVVERAVVAFRRLERLAGWHRHGIVGGPIERLRSGVTDRRRRGIAFHDRRRTRDRRERFWSILDRLKQPGMPYSLALLNIERGEVPKQHGASWAVPSRDRDPGLRANAKR